MSASSDDFFSSDTEVPDAAPRDRWGRPLLVPADGGEPQPYTRASTLANYIEDFGGLHTWRRRHVALGVGLRPDLAAKAASVKSLTGDRRVDAPRNKVLDEVIEEAETIAGEHAKSNWGTAVHGFTDPGMAGAPHVPEAMRPDIESYWSALADLGAEVLASEVFVVNDELGAAGTFDMILHIPGIGAVVADKKTGVRKMHKTAIQLAVYAGGQAYDLTTGARTPLEDLCGRPVVRDLGLYVDIPRGEGVTRFVDIDLGAGLTAARWAASVRDWRRRKDFHLDAGRVARTLDIRRAISFATSAADLALLWEANKDIWTPVLTELGRARLAGPMVDENGEVLS